MEICWEIVDNYRAAARVLDSMGALCMECGVEYRARDEHKCDAF